MKWLSHITVMALMLTLLGVGFIACSDDSCYDNGSSLPLATFYLGGSQQTINGLTIKGVGVPGDSLLADSSSLSEVYLPLRASVGSTTFAFSRWVTIGNERHRIHDTLTIDYQPIEYFHSVECGAMYNFDVEQITHTTHGIDSVVLINKLITNEMAPSLRIYFTE